MLSLARLDGKPEIFYSFQGEGRNMGLPSVFVRLSQCNLHCIWCDTDYTWNWAGTRFRHVLDGQPGYAKYDRATWIEEMEVAEVAARVRSFSCRHVILTGGEPLLQDGELSELMVRLREADGAYTFAVETNGTLIPGPRFQQAIDQYNVSPKLENSNNARKLREKPDAYRFFAENPKAWFKFVVERPQDLTEVLQLVNRYGIPSSRVYLMPEGTRPETLQKRQLWLAEVCKEHGFSLSDRLHVRLYGSKRGV